MLPTLCVPKNLSVTKHIKKVDANEVCFAEEINQRRELFVKHDGTMRRKKTIWGMFESDPDAGNQWHALIKNTPGI